MRRYHRQGRRQKYSRNYNRRNGSGTRFDQFSSSRGIYRSRKGVFMGVCKGLAEQFNFSVFWIRTIVLLLFLFTGFWPVGVMYIVAGLIMKVEPVSPIHNEKDEEFYDTYTHSRETAIQRIKRKFENIERRIQRMEHTVTSREFNWK